MTAPLRGDDLAYAALDYIREHPGEWDQLAYFCGSTACFAGRAIMLGLGLTSPEEARYTRAVRGSLTEIAESTARELLGWTVRQGDYVFFCLTRDFTKLEQRVKDVLNGDVK